MKIEITIDRREPLFSLLERFVVAVEKIATPPAVKLAVRFAPGRHANKGESPMGLFTPGPFTDADNDVVPYDIQAVDANDAPATISGGVLALTSTDGNSTVQPNPGDETGATGNLIAKAGYAGPVSGDASFTPTGADSPSLTGTWSGTFTPGAPASLVVTFGPGAPAAPAGS